MKIVLHAGLKAAKLSEDECWRVLYNMIENRVCTIFQQFSFWSLAVCKRWREEGLVHLIMWMMSVSTKVGRQGEGFYLHFMQAFFVLNKEQYICIVFSLCECSKLQHLHWDRNYKKRPQAHSFDQGPLPTSAYLDRHWHHSHDKIVLSSIFALCKRSKTGQRKCLGMRPFKSQKHSMYTPQSTFYIKC